MVPVIDEQLEELEKASEARQAERKEQCRLRDGHLSAAKSSLRGAEVHQDAHWSQARAATAQAHAALATYYAQEAAR